MRRSTVAPPSYSRAEVGTACARPVASVEKWSPEAEESCPTCVGVAMGVPPVGIGRMEDAAGSRSSTGCPAETTAARIASGSADPVTTTVRVTRSASTVRTPTTSHTRALMARTDDREVIVGTWKVVTVGPSSNCFGAHAVVDGCPSAFRALSER